MNRFFKKVYRWFGSWAPPADSQHSRRVEGCSWMSPPECLSGRSCSAAVCCIWTELLKDDTKQSGLGAAITIESEDTLQIPLEI